MQKRALMNDEFMVKKFAVTDLPRLSTDQPERDAAKNSPGFLHDLNQPLAAAANYLGAIRMILSRSAANDTPTVRLLELVDLATAEVMRANRLARAAAPSETVPAKSWTDDAG